ncbi:SapC family protein [Thiomicrospira microaerophila]|uniref:SapC family protein n=1 Tax=Thiomicrospira microaerophila TaxID=406020 RepID=UPI0005CA884F|nr:SapC family protein [Thiomicrospira microaerophila]
MPHFIAIQSSLHAQSGFIKKDNYSHAQQDTVVPILWEELAHIMPYLPLCFVKQGANTSSYQLVALQGLSPNQNVLLHPENQKWLLGYVPAHYRGYPFALIKDASSDKKVLCFDIESELLKNEQELDVVPFFEQGQPSQILKNTLQFLEMTEKSQAQTQHAVDQLAEQDLLCEWNIQIKTSDNQTIPLKGLYKIDETKLKALAPAQVGQLNKTGVLAIAYAQLLSEHQLKNVQRLHQIHAQAAQVPEELDLDTLFSDDDDSFKF